MSSAYGAWNILACLAIFAWSLFCGLHHLVRDGIIGKVIFAFVSVSAMAVIVCAINGSDTAHAQAALNAAIALVGVRHIVMKTVWPKLCQAVRTRLKSERLI